MERQYIEKISVLLTLTQPHIAILSLSIKPMSINFLKHKIKKAICIKPKNAGVPEIVKVPYYARFMVSIQCFLRIICIPSLS